MTALLSPRRMHRTPVLAAGAALLFFLALLVSPPGSGEGSSGDREASGTGSGPLVDVIVNSTIYAGIKEELTIYEQDVEAAGYDVRIVTRDWDSHQELRAFLLTELNNDLAGAVFVGELPVAWYEIGSGDDAIFPIDIYYMDLDGDFIDSDGDGIYDKHEGETGLEIWFGRLSAAALSDDETWLLRNYFQKNHAYRTGNLSAENRALVYVDDDWYGSAEQWKEDMMLLYPATTLVKNKTVTTAADFRERLTRNYEWVQMHAHSNHTKVRHHFKVNHEFEENDEVNSSQIREMAPPSLFYNLFTCRATNYTARDYIGGWYVFAREYGIAAVGSTKSGAMLHFDDFYRPLGDGKCLGISFNEWFGKHGESSPYWFYGMTILGDPTLGPKLVDLQMNLTLPGGEVTEGQPVTITAGVFNNGTRDVNDITVAFYCDGKENEHLIGTAGLSVSTGTAAATQVWWNPEVGQHTIYAVADLDHNITDVSLNMYRANVTVQVEPAKPVVLNISYAPGAVFRGDPLVIYINASSLHTGKSNLTCMVQLRAEGENWTGLENVFFVDDHWEATFLPAASPPGACAACGFHDVRVNVTDEDGRSSGWFEDLAAVEVLNNPPVLENISFSCPSCSSCSRLYPGDVAVICINASDAETPERELVCMVGYRAPSGGWEELHSVVFVDDHWEAAFSPGDAAEPGPYDVRVNLTDADHGSTGWREEHDRVVVREKPVNHPPTAHIHSIEPGLAGEGDTVTFTGSGADEDGAITGYEWRSSIDGLLGSDRVSSSSILSNGSHTVSFRVKDDNESWSDPVTAQLTINGIPRPLIASVEPDLAVEGDEIIFEGSGEDDGSIREYRWRSSIDGFLDGRRSFSSSHLSPGTHEIFLQVMDDHGFWSGEVSVTIGISEYRGGDPHKAAAPRWQVGQRWRWEVEHDHGGERFGYDIVEEIVRKNVRKSSPGNEEYDCYEIAVEIHWHENGTRESGTIWLSGKGFLLVGEEPALFAHVSPLLGLFSFPMKEGDRWWNTGEMECVGIVDMDIGGKDYSCFMIIESDSGSTWWYSPAHEHMVKAVGPWGHMELEAGNNEGTEDEGFEIAGVNGYIVAAVGAVSAACVAVVAARRIRSR